MTILVICAQNQLLFLRLPILSRALQEKNSHPDCAVVLAKQAICEVLHSQERGEGLTLNEPTNITISCPILYLSLVPASSVLKFIVLILLFYGIKLEISVLMLLQYQTRLIFSGSALFFILYHVQLSVLCS